MKIAIMTQPLGKNYGGMMQAYALQKILRNMGHEAVTIDRRAKERGFIYNNVRAIYRALKKIKDQRKAPIYFESHYDFFFENTNQFVSDNITTSERLTSTEELKIHFSNNKYSLVIVGSDQTWRPKYSPNICNFYFDFLKNEKIKRVAYASSFGVDSWEYTDEETALCGELAKSFDAISVREESGIELCTRYLGVKSECVLDPTLLLEQEDYLELIGDRFKNDSGKGVFTYFLDNNEEKKDAAEQLANKLNTHTYKCQAKLSISNPVSSNLNDYKMPLVEDWLASFANAEFVLTDSFHGMVFSIIFGKPFIVIGNHERGVARFYSLLKKLERIDCLVDSPSVINRNIDKLKDISPVDKGKLVSFQLDSISFINSCFKE